MLKSYLQIASRNLKKRRIFSVINIAGLSVAIACCMVVFLYVKNEMSYDRFNVNADRIYRLVWHFKLGEAESQIPLVGPAIEVALVNDFPEVKQAVSLRPGKLVVNDRGDYVDQKDVYYTEDSFFQVFTVHFIEGNPSTALRQPNTVVLTQATARKYFGDADPVGSSLKLNDGTLLKVTGVVAGFPDQAHFHFDVLRRLKDSPFYDRRIGSWEAATVYTYVLLNKGANISRLENGFQKIVDRETGGDFSQPGNYNSYWFQPLTSIHLQSHLQYELEPNGNILYIYIVITVALFILIIACLNFLNLATARSLERFKEIGVRKVLGSDRRQIVEQLFVETLLQVTFAALVGLAAVELLLPSINAFIQRDLSLSALLNLPGILSIVIFALLVTVLSGAYPAFYVSSFAPIAILRNRTGGRSDKEMLRKSLVVFQFFITISTIACTLVLYEQINYVKSRDLGFNKEHVLVVKNVKSLGIQYAAFRDALTAQPGILDATAAQSLPGYDFDSMIFLPQQPANYKETSLSYDIIDQNFVNVLKLKIIKGRNFSLSFPSDSSAYLINQAAAVKLGWKNPIGKKLESYGGKGPIIGEVEDFNYQSLRHAIQPVVFPFIRWQPSLIAVRLKPGDISGRIAEVRKTWKDFAPDQPFEYSFLDQDFNRLYQSEEQMAEIFVILSMLAILIASLGLFGLASYAVQQRTKEIGVRKVLGASVQGIAMLLARDFLLPVLLAGALAIPAADYVMHRWLQSFAYRVDIGVWVFLLSIMIALVVSGVSIGYRTIRAARANPVESLRYE